VKCIVRTNLQRHTLQIVLAILTMISASKLMAQSTTISVASSLGMISTTAAEQQPNCLWSTSPASAQASPACANLTLTTDLGSAGQTIKVQSSASTLTLNGEIALALNVGPNYTGPVYCGPASSDDVTVTFTLTEPTQVAVSVPTPVGSAGSYCADMPSGVSLGIYGLTPQGYAYYNCNGCIDPVFGTPPVTESVTLPAGQYAFTVQPYVEFDFGAGAMKVSWSIAFTSQNAPLQIVPSSLPFIATVGKTYTASVMATGGKPPYTWFLTAVPPGLSITTNADGTGTISGTPTTPSPDYPIEYPPAPPGIMGTRLDVQVRDSTGNTANAYDVITIYGVYIQPFQTPEQKTSNFNAFIGYFGLSAFLSYVAAELDCEAIPACVNTVDGTVSGMATEGIAAYLNAVDPIDSNYEVLATPPTIPVTLLTQSSGLSATQIEAVNSFLQNVQEQTSLRWAIYQSINRASGARQDGATTWEMKQLAQAKHFSYSLSNLISAQAPLRANMATALGFEISLTSAQLNAIYASFASGQPSGATIALLEKGGMSQTQIDQFSSLYQSIPDSSVPTSFPSYLTSSALASSDQASIQGLLNFAADVNNDLQVTCADMAAVKAAFGSKVGQANYNPLADVNGDGIVNVLDLAIVARQLPAGTTCN
jgi:hypothetical protein